MKPGHGELTLFLQGKVNSTFARNATLDQVSMSLVLPLKIIKVTKISQSEANTKKCTVNKICTCEWYVFNLYITLHCSNIA